MVVHIFSHAINKQSVKLCSWNHQNSVITKQKIAQTFAYAIAQTFAYAETAQGHTERIEKLELFAREMVAVEIYSKKYWSTTLIAGHL